MTKHALSEFYSTRINSGLLRRGPMRAFVAGLASLLTILPSTAPRRSPERGDALKALRGDFIRIGGDMRTAIRKER